MLHRVFPSNGGAAMPPQQHTNECKIHLFIKGAHNCTSRLITKIHRNELLTLFVY